MIVGLTARITGVFSNAPGGSAGWGNFVRVYSRNVSVPRLFLKWDDISRLRSGSRFFIFAAWFAEMLSY